MPETKLHDERHRIARKRGNGQLRREIWVDDQGAVTRYNLAYINHAQFNGDNGRVLGYDNHHGVHHRHLKGEVQPFEFVSFEDVEKCFEREWTELLAAFRKAGVT